MNKTKSLAVALLSCLILSCKKEKEAPKQSTAPAPTLAINYGYQVSGGYDFILFKNQKSVPKDSITAHEYLGVSFLETNLKDNGKMVSDSLVHLFDARTKNDIENFDSRTFKGSYGTSVLKWLTIEVEAHYYMPYKFGSAAKHNNDTLEFENGNDFVRIQYQSNMSALNKIDTLHITP